MNTKKTGMKKGGAVDAVSPGGEGPATSCGRCGRRPRRLKKHRLSAEEMVNRLRLVYVHVCHRIAPSVAWLSRVSGVPYETLRHFLTDPKHLLCPVNEEKLARALGHNSEYYRRLVRRKRKGASVSALCLEMIGWLQGMGLDVMVKLMA